MAKKMGIILEKLGKLDSIDSRLSVLEKLEKLDKIDLIAKDITHIKVTLGEQHVSLDEHMKRTALNEKAISWIYKTMILLALTALGGLVLFVFEHASLK